MAKIYGLSTQIIRFLRSNEEEIQFGLPDTYDIEIVFDSETNPNIINGLDTDWNSYTIENGELYRDGQLVIINPPGESWITEENKEDVKARFLLSQLQGKSPEEIYILMQTRMDNWTSLADARTDLREWLPLMASAIAWIIMKD